jgi:broad specificity phosphatase PhoE
MELVFVRHGEPAWVDGGRGRIDPRLTEKGLRQAELVAERLAGEKRPVTEILVSPARRAIETAAPLAKRIGLEPTVVDELTELRLPPSWEDTPPTDVVRALLEARARPLESWWDGLAGGESFRDFHVRVTSCIEDVLRARGIERECGPGPHALKMPDTPARIVVVAHGGTNAVVLGHLLGLPPAPWEWERLALGHASIARVRVITLGEACVFSLRSMNDVEHLPRDLRTG